MTYGPANMSEAAAWSPVEIAGRKFSVTDAAVLLFNTAMLIALMLMMAATGCETTVPA